MAECAIAEIGPTWQAIFSQWLPASGYVPDEAAPAFEEFIEEGPSPEDTTVRVHLPLRRAGP